MRHQVLSPSGMAALPSRTYTHNVASSRFIRDRLVTIHSGIHHYRAVSHVPGHHLSHMSPYRTGHRCPTLRDKDGPCGRGSLPWWPPTCRHAPPPRFAPMVAPDLPPCAATPFRELTLKHLRGPVL